MWSAPWLRTYTKKFYHFLVESSSGILGKFAPDRFEMTAAPQSANSPADGPCYFKEKKRAQRSIVGSTPRYPS